MIPIKRHQITLLSIPLLLLIPFIGMQISKEVNWSVFDFIIMAALLMLLTLAIEFTLRIFKFKLTRFVLLGTILFLFFLIWAELAAGIIKTPFSGD
ncbi:hypothetical protein LB452_05725 [Psychroflexus sp. CAK8W]|uniref:Uncharacterized protein n=1 Tax=Psychroflexus longus TaxID=2873596 RepID=A0ABS7XIW8_9FLAO|nr:hypothetical protein [Psychroflexus longus]MBZ9778419.1 hypothetical protein [Psychroflexus longus]